MKSKSWRVLDTATRGLSLENARAIKMSAINHKQLTYTTNMVFSYTDASGSDMDSEILTVCDRSYSLVQIYSTNQDSRTKQPSSQSFPNASNTT